MGVYINTGNNRFRRSRNSEYVDKSGLISVVNKTLFTRFCFSCVTRCRRFGKSMAAEMLCAYYDHSCDSRELFTDLAIAQDPSFEEHLNKYPVIYLDMTAFVTRYHDDPAIVSYIDVRIKEDVAEAYPDVEVREGDDLMDYLIRISARKQEHFIFIIDEWDAICREFNAGSQAMDAYVGWLRRMFKAVAGNDVFAGVYMTGILPIKKYKTESALNNFTEYSMFNPNSVMQALQRRRCRSFWASTGAYDAVAAYIKMNFDGLKDDILYMLAGGRCKVDPTGFQNDMSIVRSRDDVLTVLIHLGYLSYDWRSSECFVPCYEVAGELYNATKMLGWELPSFQLQSHKTKTHSCVIDKG